MKTETKETIVITETETPVTVAFTKVIEKEGTRFKGKRKSVMEVIEKLERLGLYEKPTYRFPMKDTIGKTLWKEFQKGKPI